MIQAQDAEGADESAKQARYVNKRKSISMDLTNNHVKLQSQAKVVKRRKKLTSCTFSFSKDVFEVEILPDRPRPHRRGLSIIRQHINNSIKQQGRSKSTVKQHKQPALLDQPRILAPMKSKIEIYQNCVFEINQLL